MAISSFRSFLMHKASSASAYSKLVDVLNIPEFESSPEMIEITTLSQSTRCYMPGLKGGGSNGMDFEALYDKATYRTLKALEDSEENFAVWYGGTGDGASVVPTGEYGKFEFKGYLCVTKSSAGLNEAQKMKITIAKSSVPTLAADSVQQGG